jgi:thiol:disulfide interchange protein DsbD
MRALWTLIIAALWNAPLAAGLLPAGAEAGPAVHPVKASLVAETKGFLPGQALTVALRLEQEPGWHTYWRDPGDAGLATTVDWDLPTGVKAGPLLWPKPMVFKDPGGLTGYGYLDEAFLLTEIKIPAAYADEKLTLKAQANWLVCKDVCIPGDAGVSLVLAKLSPNGLSANAVQFAQLRPRLGLPPAGYKPSGAPGKAAPVAPKPKLTRVAEDQLEGFEGAALPKAEPAPAQGLLGILLLAFLGGLLLNLMPCVLPVLSLKALSFVEHAHESRARSFKLGMAFAAGVFASFWSLAALVLALKQGGQAVGWGFQYQQPGFVLFMAALMTAFALNLFGLYEILLPGSATQGLHKASRGQGVAGAFGHGLVITLLATPCTAPFLGTALGYAFAAPSYALVLAFTAVALGLALPYMILAVVPSAHAWLPKPGPWMLRFKALMGFSLLGTAIWLLSVLGQQCGPDAMVSALGLLLLLSIALWAWGQWGGPLAPPERYWTLVFVLLFGLGSAIIWLAPRALRPVDTAPAQRADGWRPWDEAEIARLRAAGTPVFVDFGADWCWTCKVNERVVLSRDDVKAALAASGAVLMKADWTRADPAIGAALKGFGRAGVPVYVWYGKGQEPVVLPEVLTPQSLMNALKR